MFREGRAFPEELHWMTEEHMNTPTPVAMAIYSDYLMRDYTEVLPTRFAVAGYRLKKQHVEQSHWLFSCGLDLKKESKELKPTSKCFKDYISLLKKTGNCEPATVNGYSRSLSRISDLSPQRTFPGFPRDFRLYPLPV